MKAKHTPGPWHCISGAVYRDGGDNPGAPIAFMCRDERASSAGIYPVERDANARLIAAAPELLEALDEVLWAGESQHDEDLSEAIDWERVRAAIAKARGETP